MLDMIAQSEYVAPSWLPGGHAQTIYPAKILRTTSTALRRERWTKPDNDFIDVDFLAGSPNQPFLVLFHGLEGSSQSHYARSVLKHLAQCGWSAAIPHFRGCSGELNLAPRFYHSGDANEINWILRRLQQHTACTNSSHFFASGVSLGGNALLRWLGEFAEESHFVDAACAISAPLDLAAGGAALSRGINMIYTQSFLRTLKPKCLKKLKQFPKLFNVDTLLAARDLYEFDNVVTAPLHGYRDTNDYWNRASAKHVLPMINVPTLVLNARNDPFLPEAYLPTLASKAVTLEYPETGGHVGFVSGAMPGHLHWLPQRITDFLTAHSNQKSLIEAI